MFQILICFAWIDAQTFLWIPSFVALIKSYITYSCWKQKHLHSNMSYVLQMNEIEPRNKWIKHVEGEILENFSTCVTSFSVQVMTKTFFIMLADVSNFFLAYHAMNIIFILISVFINKHTRSFSYAFCKTCDPKIVVRKFEY